jgi:hypothetical protein
MLFDLKGRRRRAVQGVYLALAILMGGGLVLFGIGSDVSGGLGDLFRGDGGSNTGNEVVEKKIKAAEKKVDANPKDHAALAQIVRGHYQLATVSSDPNTGEFSKDGLKELEKATDAWERYLAAEPPKPDESLARVVVQAYTGLAQGAGDDQQAQQRYWQGAAEATELIAEARPNSNNYLALVQYATLAGQTRKADLAGKKAIDLAPKGQRKQVEQQVEQAKAAGATQPGASPGGE